MTSAVIYLRVSSASQAADTANGLDRQREACEKYAADHGLEIAATFTEVYTGTELKGRTALHEMISFLAGSETSCVLVENMDRLARESITGQMLIQDFQKSGVEILSANGSVLSDESAEGKLIRGMLLAVAEYNKDLLVMRMLLGRKRRRAENGGKCEGRPTFESTTRGAVIASTALRMANEGISCRDIAAHLNAQDQPNSMGCEWTREAVVKLVRRYRGRLRVEASQLEPGPE